MCREARREADGQSQAEQDGTEEEQNARSAARWPSQAFRMLGEGMRWEGEGGGDTKVWNQDGCQQESEGKNS